MLATPAFLKAAASTSSRPLRHFSMATTKTAMIVRHTKHANHQPLALVQVLQLHAFSTSTSKHEQDDRGPGLAPLLPPATIDELVAENAGLKKDLEQAQTQLAQAESGLLGTVKRHGLPFLFWWGALYISCGVGLYTAFNTGLLNGGQIIDWAMSIGLDQLIDPARLNPNIGSIALAVIANEALEPLRFPFALATVPAVRKLLSRKRPSKTA